MKRIIASLFFSLFLINVLSADCAASGIYAWPSQISRNPVIIIEGYAFSQEIITGFNTKYKVYLRSGNSVVPLQVLKTYVSRFNLTQAVLKPAGLLDGGKTYTLEIDSLTEAQKKDFRRDEYSWVVNDIVDNELPQWKVPPVYLSKSIVYYGCGPGMHVNFCACINEASAVLVHTKLKHLKSGKEYEYLVRPDSTMLRIGHGMCSGQFDFEPAAEYEISFSLMDASGNTNAGFTRPVRFLAPGESDENNKDETSCTCPPGENDQAGDNRQLTIPEEKSPDTLIYILLSAAGLLLIAFSVFLIRRKR